MIGQAERIWLMLIGLTFVGVFLGERGEAGWLLTLVAVTLIALKGSIVIDYYMDMRSANKKIRKVLQVFVFLIPVLVVFVQGWSNEISQITKSILIQF